MNKSRNQLGFTMVEMLIANFLLVGVIVTFGLVWWYVKNNYEFSISQMRLTANATRAVDQLAQELREAQIAANGAYPLLLTNDNEITFYADVDQDQIVERVHYWLDGNNIRRGVLKPSGNPPTYNGNETTIIITELIDPTHGPLFRYYNGNWPGDTTNNPLVLSARILNTRMIEIRLPLLIHNITRNETFEAHTMVAIRNLKDNL